MGTDSEIYSGPGTEMEFVRRYEGLGCKGVELKLDFLKLEGPESKMTIIELPAELFYKWKIWWTWSTRW